MSTHIICFRGEIRKYQHFVVENSALSEAIFAFPEDVSIHHKFCFGLIFQVEQWMLRTTEDGCPYMRLHTMVIQSVKIFF